MHDGSGLTLVYGTVHDDNEIFLSQSLRPWLRASFSTLPAAVVARRDLSVDFGLLSRRAVDSPVFLRRNAMRCRRESICHASSFLPPSLPIAFFFPSRLLVVY